MWPALASAPYFEHNEETLDVLLDIFRLSFQLKDYDPLVFDGIKTNIRKDVWTCKVSSSTTGYLIFLIEMISTCLK